MRAFLIRLVAVLAVLVAALPAGAFQRAQFFCRMMGEVVHEACCCGHEDEPQARLASAKIRAQGCCSRIEGTDPLTTQATRAVSPDLPLQALLAFQPAPPVLVLDREGAIEIAPPSARAPPTFGPPLFLKHRVLLT